MHININRLLPKTAELRYISKRSETAVIGISVKKLDDSVLSSEIQLENFDLIRSYRDRHGGGDACFIRNNLSYNTKSFLPSERENIFIEIFVQPFIVDSIYRLPYQGTIIEHFSKINKNDTKICIFKVT